MPRDRESLVDILDSAKLAVGYLKDLDQLQFWNDIRNQDSVVRRIEIIGEATKRISNSTRDRFPSIPWKEMEGMRDRVIHGYDTIDLDIVWRTVKDLFPQLIAQIESILASESFEDESAGD